jgi:hypothetical protein
MAMAAAVFTISCSDGENGKDGPACSVVSKDGGYDVICGGAVVGELTNGPSGSNGAPGTNGIPGPDCELISKGDSYEISCNGEIKGELSGCSTVAEGYEVTISCIGNSVVSLCDGTPFDPADQYCDATGTPRDHTTNCAGAKFNPLRSYCGFSDEAAFKAGTPSVLPLCVKFVGGVPVSGDDNIPLAVGELPLQPNQADLVSGEWVLKESGVTDWQDEYCFVKRTYDRGTIVSEKPSLYNQKIDSVYSTAKPEWCGGNLTKFNENKWKGEYCGYADAETVTKSRLSNACGDGKGPDSLAFGKSYCQMQYKSDFYTEATETYCEEGAAKTKTPINKVDKNGKLSTTDWLSEYCGYESYANTEAEIAKKLAGICDDGEAPNKIGNPWMNEYCQVQITNRLTGRTKLVGGEKAYCMEDAASNYETATASARLNEKKWSDQYCGYSSAANANAEIPKPSRLIGVCTAGAGSTTIGEPQVLSYDEGIKPRGPNDEVQGWDNGYCQVQSPTATTTVLVGWSTKAVAWNEVYESAYCNKKPEEIEDGSAKTASNSTDGRFNARNWADQACVYRSAQNKKDSASTSRADGFCDDGKMPNSITRGTTITLDGLNNPTGVNMVRSTFWKNEYCQAQYNSAVLPKNRTTQVKGIPEELGTKNATSSSIGYPAAILEAFDYFCLADTTITIPANATGTDDEKHAAARLAKYQAAGEDARINGTRWSNQYCGFSNKTDLEKMKKDEAITSINDATKRAPKFSRLSTRCTNAAGDKPNAAGDKLVWLAEYCQADITGVSKKVGLTAGAGTNYNDQTPGVNVIVYGGVYCGMNSSGKDESGSTITSPIQLTAKYIQSLTPEDAETFTLNKSAWSNQYCFQDSKRSTCSSSQKPIGLNGKIGCSDASLNTKAKCEGKIQWSTAFCKTKSTGVKNNIQTKALCDGSPALALVNEWIDKSCGSCGIGTIGSTVLDDESEAALLTAGGIQACEKPRAIWTDDNEGKCDDAVSSTSQTTCETAKNTWTPDDCDDNAGSTSQTACQNPKNTWTPGSCSDGASPDESTCTAALETWTAGSCSDGSFPDESTCEDIGVWTIGHCDDDSGDDKTTCEGGSNSWLSGTCSDSDYDNDKDGCLLPLGKWNSKSIINEASCKALQPVWGWNGGKWEDNTTTSINSMPSSPFNLATAKSNDSPKCE